LERRLSKLLIGEKSMTTRKTLVEKNKAGTFQLASNPRIDAVPFDHWTATSSMALKYQIGLARADS
jgi:hypothetical protein